MAEDYCKLLALFMESIRYYLDIKELPFVVGEINSHSWAFGDIARKSQAEACMKDPNCILVKTTDLSRDGVGGKAHFDADAMITLGNRFADGMLELILKKKTSLYSRVCSQNAASRIWNFELHY